MRPRDRGGFSSRSLLGKGIALVACLGIALWSVGRFMEGSRARVAEAGGKAGPAKPARDGKNREEKEKRSPRELVDEWLAVADAAGKPASPASVITITSMPSPERREAFQRLLAALDRENAGVLHDLLSVANSRPGGGALTDAEWKAILEKWGRLDGAGAVAHLADHPDLPWRAPGVLSGWASVDPSAAVAWLDGRNTSGESPPWRGAAEKELILGWLHLGFEGPTQWLYEHQDDPAFPQVVAAFAAEAAASDPKAALAWARTVEGPWRSWALQNVGRQWLAWSPGEATAALQDAGFDPEAIERMKAAEPEGYDLTKPSGSAARIGIASEAYDVIHIGE